MSIIVKKSTMVYPAEETPKKTLWLSRIDMIIRTPYAHNRTLFIYHHRNSKESSTTFFDGDIMRESLSKALVAFYPMAGRLRMNEIDGRYEIDCNEEGVLYVEAETPLTLDEFKPNDDFRKELVPSWDYSRGLSSFPLVMAQITRFKCGGVCLGMANHHHAFDGTAAVHLNNSWARLARGLHIDVVPVHDRIHYLGPRDPPQIKFQHLEFQPPLPPLPPKDSAGKVCDAIECVFKLSKAEIEALRQQAMCKVTPNYNTLTTFEVLTAHVWRCSCKARGLAGDQDVRLYVTVNGRPRLKDPTLPQGYVGNVLFYPTCTTKAKDIVHKSLAHVASKVHEMMKKMQDVEYLRSAIDYLESQPDIGPFVHNADTFTSPNLRINSWVSIPFGEADYGWGKPDVIRHGGVKWEGQGIFISSTNGDGSLFLAIKLFKPHMALFGKHFYGIESQVEGKECRTSRL